MGFIYGLYHPDSKYGTIRYVGLTRGSISKRISNHVGRSKDTSKNPTRLSCWIRKYGKPYFVVIDEVPNELLDETEIFWISEFRFSGFPLLNLLDGGGSNPGGEFCTDETRAKISKALRIWNPVKVLEEVLRCKGIPNQGRKGIKAAATREFGSWRKACEIVGIEARKPGRPRSRITS